MSDEYIKERRALTAALFAFRDCIERSRKKNPKAWNFKWDSILDCVRNDSISIASITGLQHDREMRKELFKQTKQNKI